MTDNEIVKALDWWITVAHNVGSITISKEEILAVNDLINRLQADKEALIAGQETLQKALAAKIAEYEALKVDEEREHQYCKNVCEPKFKAEIERLKCITTSNPYCVSIGTADIFTANHEEYEWLLTKISAEAIREFAERLKEKFSGVSLCNNGFVNSTLDNLVKEMVGDMK